MRLAAIGYILLFVLNSCSRERAYNVPGCSDVWNGRFFIIKGGETTLEILRNGDDQIERTNDGVEHKYKVQWLDSWQVPAYASTRQIADIRTQGSSCSDHGCNGHFI